MKIIATCLLGAGLMAAVTTLPQSQAHEGHNGHDHGETFSAPQESLQQTRPTELSNDVVTSPPPFETLGSEQRPLLDPPLTTPSDRNEDPLGSVNRNSRQPRQLPFDRFSQRNTSAEDGQSFSQNSPDVLDQFAHESCGAAGCGLDRFSPQENFPSRPRFSRSMSDRSSRGGPRDTCGYDADRYCATDARFPYTSTSSCNLADVDDQHSYSRRIDFDRTDYRQHRGDFQCPVATGSCDSFASQYHY